MTNLTKTLSKSVALAFIVLALLAFTSKAEDKLYLNYKAAIENESTFQFYLVIKLKDKNTGETREYCTKGDYLKGAIHREYKIGYSEEEILRVYDIALKSKERYLEFSNNDALRNIGAGSYTLQELAELEARVNFDSLAKKIKADKEWHMGIIDKEQVLYAHALFNRGILTGESNCVGGTLIYVDRENSEF